jgi:hypothetical protein
MLTLRPPEWAYRAACPSWSPGGDGQVQSIHNPGTDAALLPEPDDADDDHIMRTHAVNSVSPKS